jgi:hypothetical protein
VLVETCAQKMAQPPSRTGNLAWCDRRQRGERVVLLLSILKIQVSRSTAVEATIATIGTKSSFGKVFVIALPEPFVSESKIASLSFEALNANKKKSYYDYYFRTG